ncbi:hypothetical protein JR316_0002881 [Psilocybe cubensis]|uniref:Uncharacterized protein n=2 Tax=Psilocybe cubensis TaxID=181762 RepID=A0A8H8CMF1_PSICU|nr:hypothetical protein JR316_0002881 [Psilocybe cubensis]KAH9483415.1 hypothetical protein JR316_0002881 [Psilocybe cubensis]
MPPLSTGLHAQSNDQQDIYTDSSELFGVLRNLLGQPNVPNQVPSTVISCAKNLVSYLQSHISSESHLSSHEHIYLPSTVNTISTTDLNADMSSVDVNQPQKQDNIQLNRKTRLSTLYTYGSANAIIEYPETSEQGVGYLMPADLTGDRLNPAQNSAYSLGPPNGSSTAGPNGKPITCKLLTDQDGNEVPCRVTHFTCQGMKICPFADQEAAVAPHTKPSKQMLHQRLALINAISRRDTSFPSAALFKKTLAYFTALQRQGCRSPLFEATLLTGEDAQAAQLRQQQQELESRGHPEKLHCHGRLFLDYTHDGTAFIRCEHYNAEINRDHFIDFTIGNGLLDTEYLEALLQGDEQAFFDLEYDAAQRGVGPLSKCTTINNHSVMKVCCPNPHRDPNNGKLVSAPLIHLPCKVTVRTYEPVSDDDLKRCPQILMVVRGVHRHPIPIPTKTPPSILRSILQLLQQMGDSLPDLTPRRLLRHPLMKSFLHQRLPHIPTPMLLDLHPSLSNREHLRVYIEKVKNEKYPMGTGWEGLLNFKSQQDTSSADPYIRFAGELPDLGKVCDEDTELTTEEATTPLRVVICMLKINSHRLLNAKYIQSDIGFKRVVGWKEFELGGLDETTGLSVTYCRVFLTRQTADAHRFVLHQIDGIVKQDTGQNLMWRHIHSPVNNASQAVGICHLAVDQHAGQAKGYGQYFCDIAQQYPLVKDIHEPHKNIQDLSEYDHVRRILRLCKNHYLRNIQSCAVPDNVRQKMRSLMCISHPTWNMTLREIREQGGKAANDWLHDKERAKFVWPAICWEFSCIPLDIWKVGDSTSNIIEQLHEDVNREGITCTLVGGVQKGYHFDLLKNRTIETAHATGVRPSYQRGHISESVSRSICRKNDLSSKILSQQDRAIEGRNKKLQKAEASRVTATQDYLNKSNNATTHAQAQAAARRLEKTETTFQKEVESSLSLVGTGSGKVGLLLPRRSPPSL